MVGGLRCQSKPLNLGTSSINTTENFSHSWKQKVWYLKISLTNLQHEIRFCIGNGREILHSTVIISALVDLCIDHCKLEDIS